MAVRANVLHVISVTDSCHRVTSQLQVTNNNNKNIIPGPALPLFIVAVETKWQPELCACSKLRTESVCGTVYKVCLVISCLTI